MTAWPEVVQRVVSEVQAGSSAIRLQSGPLEASDLLELSKALRGATRVTKLDLSGNPRVDDRLYKALITFIHESPNIVDLDLTGTGFSEAGLQVLCNALIPQGQLRSLNFAWTLLAPAGIPALASSLSQGSSLNALTITGVDAKAIEILGKGLRRGSVALQWLRVWGKSNRDSAYVHELARLIRSLPKLIGLVVGDTMSSANLEVLLQACEKVQVITFGCSGDETSISTVQRFIAGNKVLRAVSLQLDSNTNYAMLSDDIAQAMLGNNETLLYVDGFSSSSRLRNLLERNQAIARSSGLEPSHLYAKIEEWARFSRPVREKKSGDKEGADNAQPPLSSQQLDPQFLQVGNTAIGQPTRDRVRQNSSDLPEGAFQPTIKRFIHIPGKLREKGFIATDPTRPQIAIATQAQNKYNQVSMHSLENGAVVSVCRLGRKVGAISFNPCNGNLVVATSSGQSQLLSYEYQADENVWVLVWKKSLAGYGPFVQSMTVFGFGVFLRLEVAPAESQLDSRFLVYDIVNEQVHSVACSGELFPQCNDILFYPDRSGLMLLPRDDKSLLLFVNEIVTQIDGRIAIPPSSDMSSITVDINPKTCMIVATTRRELLVLSWDKRTDGLLDSFCISSFKVNEESTLQASSSLQNIPYVRKYGGKVKVLQQGPRTELQGFPEITDVQGAMLGEDNQLHILCVERVKMPGKKWFLFKRFIFSSQGGGPFAAN
eukprot:CAMPEP_0184560142 /NCGR_PEP_ID=MMETSP0199_2-20130426/46786_1 /TAXON_ID=1112570 /ORGANISM="Thraustochytrium sp., Strain LLF1b" /LENGTH=714 /DNA_ID=CAMNT_0026957443 /DNA_START=259 /DNA_END=2403 /DNA_ORIENTATION=+